MNISKLVRKLYFICLAALFSIQPVLAGQPLNRIVAIVNNDIISQAELDNYTKLVLADMQQNRGSSIPPKDVLQQQVINRMVLERIQLQLAAQLGIEVDSMTVSQALQNMAADQGKSMEAFKQSIEARGLNYNDYRELIRNEIIMQHLQYKEVNQEISVSKSDIESFLNSPAGQDNSGTEYKLNHILLPVPDAPTPELLRKAQQMAEELVQQLRAGADFNKVAMSKSAGKQALKGGDLGWRRAGELPTVFVNHVPTMQVGDIAGPIRSSSGLHIIRLQEKRIASDENRSETHVRQILIKTDKNTSSAEAKAILLDLKQKISKGADFAKLAEQKSQENRTAEKGGDMGWVNEQLVLPQFYQVMSTLRNNQVSEPFETEEGWHLIQVLNRRTQRTSSEAAWNKARELIGMRKANEALEAWTKRIRDEARVEIFLG